jgi:hypothetical protein
MRHRRPRPDLPFDVLDEAFRLLATGSRPLSINGADVAGLPQREIPLDELKARLLHPSSRYATRDRALEILLSRAHAEGGPWVIGLVGVLLPGLRRSAAPLVRCHPDKAADIEAEMLAAVVATMQKTPPEAPRPAARLIWAARHAAECLLRAEEAELARPGREPISRRPPRPYGHPDFVLLRAVAAGVLQAEDAELIGATRLGEKSLPEAAVALGIDYFAAQKRRRRAEAALVAWIGQTGGDFVQTRPEIPGSSCAGRPRQGRRPDQRPGLCPLPENESPRHRR